MSFQISCLDECGVTLVAFVGLFPTVHFQMSSQMACLRRCIATSVAFVWFNDIVSLFLHDFYICILWTKIINFHLFDCHGVLCIAQMIASNWSNLIIYFWSLSESVKFSLAYFHFSAFNSVGCPVESCKLDNWSAGSSLWEHSHKVWRSLELPFKMFSFWNVYLRQHWESETAFQMILKFVSWHIYYIDERKFGKQIEIWLKFHNFEKKWEIWTTFGNLVKILKFGSNF